MCVCVCMYVYDSYYIMNIATHTHTHKHKCRNKCVLYMCKYIVVHGMGLGPCMGISASIVNCMPRATQP